eukprot:4092684-Prymnesium_polylepis.1
MRWRIDGLEWLLDNDYAHVGEQLFPWAKRLSFESGCRQSLLGIAALDACSPKAVKMLLERGADPNGMINRKQCAIMGAECGPETVANYEIQTGFIPEANEILGALMEAGGDEIGAINVYEAYLNRYGEDALVEKRIELCSRQLLRRSTRVKQRFANVIAAVAIVSFWRRLAAHPDSKAAKSALKRVHALAFA